MGSRLYTKRGDDGYTGLLGSDRVPKWDPRPEAYGTLDEATSFLGQARASVPDEESRQLVLDVQRHLYGIMGELASTPETVDRFRFLTAEHVQWLEQHTDDLTTRITLPRAFIIPGDSLSGAVLDVARSVVRRGERRVARLVHDGLADNLEIVRYLNRLSSLLFVLARYQDALAGVGQVTLAHDPTPQT